MNEIKGVNCGRVAGSDVGEELPPISQNCSHRKFNVFYENPVLPTIEPLKSGGSAMTCDLPNEIDNDC